MVVMMKFIVTCCVFMYFIYADCLCVCVNGKVENVCSNSYDVKVPCAHIVCPVPSPSVKPLDALRLPPVGTTQCDKEQVYNENEGRYEWTTLCR